MDFSLNPIKDRFPNWSGLIDSLYQKNASFNTLCDDYLTVVEKIRQHSASEILISAADLEEIKTLLSDPRAGNVPLFGRVAKGARA